MTLPILPFIPKERSEDSQKNLAKLKEDFTNMIVHELRAPLTAIKDASDVIISGQYNLNKDEEKEFLEIINKQSKLLLDQIGTIMDAAKLEAGKFAIAKTPQDITTVIKNQIKIFLLQAEKKHISLKLDAPGSLPLMSFDLIRIGQALNNLLSNSLKFTPEEGSITVELRQEPKGYITVSVSDTGIGIPKEYQKDLFSKFYQAKTTPNQTAKDGTGLGLYVVKGIVEAHGGTVTVKSSQGHGTTISFTLPIK